MLRQRCYRQVYWVFTTSELYAEVDGLLKCFLLERNTFIHDIANVDGWILSTNEGVFVINRQLDELLAHSREVRT